MLLPTGRTSEKRSAKLKAATAPAKVKRCRKIKHRLRKEKKVSHKNAYIQIAAFGRLTVIQ